MDKKYINIDDIPEASEQATTNLIDVNSIPDLNDTSQRSWSDYGDNLLQQSIKGLTFGFDDEILASVVDGANAIGLTKSTGEEFRDFYEGKSKAFRESDPVASFGAGFVPAVMTKGPLSLAGSLAFGPKASQVLNATGGGRIAQAIVDSAITGFGEAEGSLGNRASSAGVNASLGAVLGGATKALSDLPADVINNQYFDNTIQRVGDLVRKDILGAEDLAKATNDVFFPAYGDLLNSTSENIPLNFFESLSPTAVQGQDIIKSSLANEARGVVKNADGAIRDAQKALLSRNDNKIQRVEKILDYIAPDITSREGAELFSNKAKSVVSSAKKALNEAVEGQQYTELKAKYPSVIKGNTPDEEIQNLLQRKEVKSLIPDIRNSKDNFNKAKIGEDADDYSTETWLDIRKRLRSKRDRLGKVGTENAINEQRDIKEVLKRVDKVLNEATEGNYDKTKKAWAEAIAKQPEVLEAQGFVNRLAVDDQKKNPISALKEFFGPTANSTYKEDLPLLQKYLGDENARIGLKIALKEAMPDNKTLNVAGELLNSNAVEQQMNMLLPKQTTTKVRNLLDLENRMARSQNFLGGNSSTATEVKQNLESLSARNILDKLSPFKQVLNELFSNKSMRENKALANVLFSTGDEAYESLKNVNNYVTLQNKLDPYRNSATKVSLGASRNLKPLAEQIVNSLLRGN